MPKAIVYIVFVISCLIGAHFVGGAAGKRWEGNTPRVRLMFQLVTLAASIAGLVLYGASMAAIKGVVFCLILLYASYSDIKVREVDD